MFGKGSSDDAIYEGMLESEVRTYHNTPHHSLILHVAMAYIYIHAVIV